jgi:DNA-binding MarR family transcriptional regulator
MRHPSVNVGTTHAASQCAAQLVDVAPLTVRFIRGQMRTQMPGLTMSQFRAMAFLYRRSGCALRELADHLGVRAATCSSLVDRLVQRGLVDRRTNMANRRQVTLALTRSGVAHVESARDVARGRTAKLLSALPDRTLRSLARNLEILADVFSRTQEQAR